MRWFQSEFGQAVPEMLWLRVLMILMDARFNQMSTAERALKNTKPVHAAGLAIRGEVTFDDVPHLNTPRLRAPEKWRRSFFESLPGLKDLATTIASGRDWTAGNLLSIMHNARIPFFGPKCRRLALRWIHELIPDLSVDMGDSQVPVDLLVYRVTSRLGIINPHTDNYSGSGRTADVRIQSFAKRCFPENPTLVDEPMWMMGRKFCHPTSPACSSGCIFRSFCPRLNIDCDPCELGFNSGASLRSPTPGDGEPRTTVRDEIQSDPVSAPRVGLLVLVSCVMKKVWDTPMHDRPSSVPAGVAYTGSLFTKSRAYAQLFGESWCVFSAKYGFVLPEELIENYNATFKERSPGLVEMETLSHQIAEKNLARFQRVEVLGGKEYVSRAREAFLKYGVTVSDPLARLKIGERLNWLDRRCAQRTPEGA